MSKPLPNKNNSVDVRGRVPTDLARIYEQAKIEHKRGFPYGGRNTLSDDGFMAAILLEFLSWTGPQRQTVLEERVPQARRLLEGESVADVLAEGLPHKR